ncbi:helix-turn-helix transcriptional regulator [Pantoea sp. FN0307]|uniref:helix-turn-helix transcriptional regulator n=1 Tax=unclassified Pantoea TaxID=2630326 RepID=UPI003CF8A3B8
MSASGPKRAERLLNLLQILRRHRYPVSGNHLAQELHISLRTLYRDITSLRTQGADIQGEAGTGYILTADYLLPPLMFTPEQLEALALGLRWVSLYSDAALSQAADETLSNIASVLPARLQPVLTHSTLLVGRSENKKEKSENFSTLRMAIRRGLKIRIGYEDQTGKQSERTLWPFALGYLPERKMLTAWCELRNDFRHFDINRLGFVQMLDARYPYSRQRLLKQWRQAGCDKVIGDNK